MNKIPLDDIKDFLSFYNIPLSSDNYLSAWNIISQNKGNLTAPPSIADWVIAHNLSQNKVKISKIRTSEILNATDTDPWLIELAQTFKLSDCLSNSNKERIIRILYYLDALDDDIELYGKLSSDQLQHKLSEFDCQSIFLICKLSPTVNNYCQSGDFINILNQKIRNYSKLQTHWNNIYTLNRVCRVTENNLHIQIVAHCDSSFIFDKNRRLYAFGNNGSGQLGFGDTHNRNIPTPLFFNSLTSSQDILTSLMSDGIVNISIGDSYTLFLMINGTIYMTGNMETKPKLLPNINNVTQITTGIEHSLLLSQNGKVYGFGFNYSGQLGLGHNYDRNVPILNPHLNNIVQLAAGANHSIALTSKGTVYSFGDNTVGQLGKLGPSSNVPQLIPDLYDIISISAGNNHTMALTANGHVYIFGRNNKGQLGLGDVNRRSIPVLNPYLNDIIQISAGGDYSMALTSTGKLYIFGKLNTRERKLDTLEEKLNTLEGKLNTRKLSISGDEINDEWLTPRLIENINSIVSISAGNGHCFILTTNGDVYSFGDNNKGQLGTGDNRNRSLPTPIFNINQ